MKRPQRNQLNREGNHSPPPPQYLRWRNLSKKEFLLRCLDERDTPTFAQAFAEWLASERHVSLVCVCFDKEPDAYRNQCRKKLLPATFRAGLASISRSEVNAPDRAKKFRKLRRFLPPAKAEAFSKEMSRLDDEFRARYVAKLVAQLARLHPFDQIKFLNAHLQRRQLLPPAPRIDRKAERAANQDGFSTACARTIFHEQVQDAYFLSHPDLQAPEKASKELMHEELGRGIVAHFARPHIGDDGFYLSRLAQELRCLPQLGDEATPVWRYLCHYPIGRLLKEQLSGGDRERQNLSPMVRTILREHLRYFGVFTETAGSNKQYRSRSSLGYWKNTTMLAENIRDSIRRAAGWTEVSKPGRRDKRWIAQPPVRVREFVNAYRLIHRTAKQNPDIVRALRDFFFHGLDINELRTRPGMVEKLMPALEQDLTLLCKFLFSVSTGKRAKGLIQHWVDTDAPGSSHRLKSITAHGYDFELRQRRDGITQAEYLPKLEQLAGAQPAPPSLMKPHLDAHLKRRKRLGLK